MGNIPNLTVLRQCFHWLDVNYKDVLFDYKSRKLTTGKSVLLFLEANLEQRKSIDDIAGNLKANACLQEWLHLEPVVGSTLNRKLNKLPLPLLQDVFYTIVQEIAQHYAGKPGIRKWGKLWIIDSTELTLPRVHGIWGFMSKTQNGVKMHTRLIVGDENSVCPDRIVASTVGVSDLNNEVLAELVVESTNTYVFDRGYINYSNYCKWVNKDIRFVARVKSSNKGRVLEKRIPPEGTNIIQDVDVELNDPKSKVTFKLRLVEYTYIDKNNKLKHIRVMTNRWDITAMEISEIYRYRWKIELFFKWMKQHLSLKKLYSYKEKAVWNQIFLSLIAYALCELIRLTVNPTKTCWFVLKNIRLYANQTVDQLLDTWNWTPSRTSKGRQKKPKRGRPRIKPKVHKATQIIIT